MVDLVVRGDTVVTPQGVGAFDIAIAGEKIVAVAAQRQPAGAGRRAADRRDRQDRHARRHRPACALQVASAQPGWHRRADRSAGRGRQGRGAWRHHDDDRLHPRHPGRQPCATRSRSARRTGRATAPATTRSTSWWKARCRSTCRGSLAEAIQAGFPTVKIFTTDITPSRARGAWWISATSGKCSRCWRRISGLGVIHSEDNDIVMHMYGKLIREGRTGFENMAEVHNTLSEDISFRRVIRLAEKVPGTALYMMHTSAATGVSARSARRARAACRSTASRLHQYMLYTQRGL